MTFEELIEFENKKLAEIEQIRKAINQAKVNFALEHSPIKVGNEIMFEKKKGVVTHITTITSLNIRPQFEYYCRFREKNGSLGNEKKISWYENTDLTKI